MTLALEADHVLVRMYNVGFGDCFLLGFGDGDRVRRVLIDCGSHSAGRGPVSIAEIAKRVVEDVTDEDGVARIDIVIATHRHQDHVSGFKAPVWRDVEVREVWMPWTEHPTDPEARRIRERQSQIARSLCLALEATPENETASALATNSLTNAAAMETLHRGFANKPLRRFLPEPSPRPASFTAQQLPGVVVHVMGPSRDPEVIRDMDPPVGSGYLRMAAEQQSDQVARPFRDDWAIEPDNFVAEPAYAHLRLSHRQMAHINELSDVDHFQIAASLDRAVNGTSLMLAFEVGDALLVFPGDAQWGTWNAVLHDEHWRTLLARTSFYKVGHHGSHNATPREYIEKLLTKSPDETEDAGVLRAAVSTRTMDIWKSIPKKELLAALSERTVSLARSDVRDKPVPDFDFVDEIVAETYVPTVKR